MANKRLFFISISLICVGVLMSYSLAVYLVGFFNYEPFHFLKRELFVAIIGILLMWLFAQLEPDESFKKIGLALFLLSLILMIGMHFLPTSLVSSAGGAKRWIRLPSFSLAPSEFFKIGFVYFLAWSFSRKFSTKKHVRLIDEIKTFIPYLALFFVAVVLIAVLQNDLGQVIVLALTLGFMLLFAGGSLRLLGIIMLTTLSVGLVAIVTSPHRIMRVKLWWANAQDSILALLPQGLAESLRVENLPEPYQIYHASNAIANGGFFGNGLGEGVIKLGFLSEVHTDIILAGIVEELGFVGLFFVVVLFCAMLFYIFKIANRVQNMTYYLFCVGVALLLAFSFIINAFGISGITPIKGIAVPFISYGGSSLLANCLAIGLVLSISRKAHL
ncbi:cell division protein FtsW [Helicobacter sp. MIT 00-7814]|uniref:FtsW/RodA/SpoVE family cell cycle protein n=1 Tax=unclassified Helicobacter TaxID=2593540 RepID=UPI000E1EE36C|nr:MULTISPECIES: FtsW/RodA/SpoVE family cell cycle protein [unclassified Helicobacter]RDU56373.1 cell division protein FtsW [Helicobacter sp. MIT 99-10781]RDU56456.1 cell division protein FtsW [Helicobacter sp. MIT 00-7814]